MLSFYAREFWDFTLSSIFLNSFLKLIMSVLIFSILSLTDWISLTSVLTLQTKSGLCQSSVARLYGFEHRVEDFDVLF